MAQMKLPPGAQLVEDKPSVKLPPGAELVSDDVSSLPTEDLSQFAAPSDNKEGLYEMQTAHGTLTKVPYSKVMDASNAGYKISPDDRTRYANDKVAAMQGNGSRIPELNLINHRAALSQLNQNTDIPQAYDAASAAPKPFTLPWLKEKAYNATRDALDLLPTAGGIGGGILGAGAGSESGPGAIITGAAGAAAGQGLGETIRQPLEEMIFNDPKMTSKEAAKNIAKQAGYGAVSEIGGRVVGKSLAPAIRYFGRTAEESSKAGVKMLPSEAAGKAPSYAEKFLKGSILTGGKMEKFRAAQNEQTKAAVDKIADGISNFKGTPEQLGELVQNGIDQHVKGFRTIQNQMYGDIAKSVNERTIKVPVTTTKQVPTGLLDQYGKPTFTTVNQTTLQDHLVDDVMPSTVPLKKFAAEELKKLDQVEKILDPNLLGQSRSMLQNILDAPKNLPFSAMRAARSDTLAKVRELDQALAGKQAGLAKKMASLFDDSIMDAVKKSGIPGLEADVRAADAFTAEEHKMFEQQLVKKVVDTKRPEAIATLIRNKNMGIEETRDLFKVMPTALHKPVQRQILVDTMRQATNNTSKAFNERKFAETIGAIGDERGQIIFGPNWKNVKELTGIMERINGPVGMQGGSGAALQNFSILKNLMLAATPFGLAEHGNYGAAAGSLAAEWASLNALATAMTNPAMTTKMLKVAQEFATKLPYAVPATINEIGGERKTAKRAKDAVDRWNKEHPDKHVSPPPTETPQTITPQGADSEYAPGPQSKVNVPASPAALRNAAEELQNSFHTSGLHPTPASQGAAPQSSNQVTHRWNPQTSQIEAA